MKQGIHPEYKPATIVCSCGNRIETRSTQDEIHVEICSVCHPFYTGKQKLVDTAGRVERFKRKYGDVSSSSGEEEEDVEASEEPEAVVEEAEDGEESEAPVEEAEAEAAEAEKDEPEAEAEEEEAEAEDEAGAKEE